MSEYIEIQEKDAPGEIWLQWYDDEGPDGEWYTWTWCSEQENDDDIRYIRADKYEKDLEENSEIEFRLRKNAYEQIDSQKKRIAELEDTIGIMATEYNNMRDALVSANAHINELNKRLRALLKIGSTEFD